MKLKIIKQEKGCYLRLPEEFRQMGEVELFQLKEGYYLLSSVLGGGGAPAKRERGEEEELIAKLESIIMRKRSPSYLKSVLGKEELKTLEALLKSGKVAYIHNKKFKEGIYVINDSGKGRAGKGGGNGNSAELTSALFASGYVIVEGNRDAQALSENLLKQKGSILGVRGFDGKYYVVTANYFQKVSEAIAQMGDEVSPEDVAEKFGLAIDGCKAVLKLLSEKGEYVEKKGGIYVRV
ncbi:hypothetical protein JW721_04830 [Candidatus Micrarchaeota archaeon]|nr:hypothetical protein [Candidatus Micrarchaeota archaeon]